MSRKPIGATMVSLFTLLAVLFSAVTAVPVRAAPGDPDRGPGRPGPGASVARIRSQQLKEYLYQLDQLQGDPSPEADRQRDALQGLINSFFSRTSDFDIRYFGWDQSAIEVESAYDPCVPINTNNSAGTGSGVLPPTGSQQDQNANANQNTNGAVDANANQNTNGAVDANANLNTNGGLDANANQNTNGAVDANANLNTNGAVDANANQNTNGAVDANANLNTNGSADANANQNTNTAGQQGTTAGGVNTNTDCPPGTTSAGSNPQLPNTGAPDGNNGGAGDQAAVDDTDFSTNGPSKLVCKLDGDFIDVFVNGSWVRVPAGGGELRDCRRLGPGQ